jgi:hypothetical protein
VHEKFKPGLTEALLDRLCGGSGGLSAAVWMSPNSRPVPLMHRFNPGVNRFPGRLTCSTFQPKPQDVSTNAIVIGVSAHKPKKISQGRFVGITRGRTVAASLHDTVDGGEVGHR